MDAAALSRLLRPVTLAALIAAAVPAQAQDRLVRTFGPEEGLTSPPVWALAQDSVGFLWIATHGGLFRYDGTEFRKWAPDVLEAAVVGVTVSPDGSIAALEVDGRAFEVTAEGARSVKEASENGVRPRMLTYDRRGVLWFTDGRMVERRADDGRWMALPSGSFGGERVRFLEANHAGGVDVLTTGGVWRVEPGASPRRLLSDVAPLDMAVLDDGAAVVLMSRAVVRLSPSGRPLSTIPVEGQGRTIGIVERHGTVWVGLDNGLVALRPGAPQETIDFDGRVTYGGELLVDREGSLWLASNALHQFPEPETRAVRALGRVGVDAARFLEASEGTLWMGTWDGHRWVRPTGAAWTAGVGPRTHAHICRDSSGALWSSRAAAILEMRGDSMQLHPFETRGTMEHCAPDRTGGVWLGYSTGVVHVGGRSRSIRTYPPPPAGEGSSVRVLLHDRDDRLWVNVDPERICSAPVRRVLAGEADAWSCEEVPGIRFVTSMVQLPSGALWASTHDRAVLAHDSAGWRSLAIGSLPTRTVFSLAPSPRGGTWMAGHGFLRRIREGPGERSEVLERITQWNGVPGPAASDVVEEEDGDLWIVYDGGLVYVPADARFGVALPPRVALVEATSDGRPVSAEGPIELAHDRNRLELRFAALSFRNPGQLHHQVRLGPDERWSASRASPSFRWVDLRPGRYEVEYRASLDGVTWSHDPARFGFRVLSPWYTNPWALTLAGLLVIAAVWAGHRARVGHVLALERQRTRIAMDLHDEVGSGLASVGILSGVLATGGLGPAERRRAANDIATAAEGLGYALSDIVWSLDPHTATLDELASRLTEHAERLCAPADLDLVTRFPPAWPDGLLDVAVRRNVLLVGLEALHNAVRHGGASRIELSLRPRGRLWELCVADDGSGFDPAPGEEDGRRGHGLRSMRRRADEIGARLDVRSGPGLGTLVELRFPLRLPDGTGLRSLADWLRGVVPTAD